MRPVRPPLSAGNFPSIPAANCLFCASWKRRKRILGQNGIPTAGRSLPTADDLPASDAFTALCNWLEDSTGPKRILALGPLTNIAALALARPDLAARIDELTWMGGGVTSAIIRLPPNSTPMPIRRRWRSCSPMACRCGWSISTSAERYWRGPTMSTVCARLRGKNAGLLADLLAGYVNIAISRGRPAMAIYDPTAAAIFVAPEIATLPARADRRRAAGTAYARAHRRRDARLACGIQRPLRRRDRRRHGARHHLRRYDQRGTPMIQHSKGEPADLNIARAAHSRSRCGPRRCALRPADYRWPLVDMVTGQIRAADIGIVGPLIASVHAPGSRTDASETIDAGGAFLSPGLIDTHMHIESSMVTPAAYTEAVLPRGVTTIVWDPHEFGNVHGLDGVRWAIEASRPLPLRVIPLAPSCVPSAPGLELAGADFDASDMADMLAWPEIGGVAEVMTMRGVIDGDPRHERDRRMPGCNPASWSAAMPAASKAPISTPSWPPASPPTMSSRPAPISLPSCSAGMTIELRGSHDHLLPQFVEVINDLGFMPQTVTLCTDDVFPDELACRWRPRRRGPPSGALRTEARMGTESSDA